MTCAFTLDLRPPAKKGMVIIMKKHSNTYEQYCYVLNKNVVMEEIIYHNGKKELKCTNENACNEAGGCKNLIIKNAIINMLSAEKNSGITAS